MNIVLIFFFCTTILLPTLVHGLECYECAICSTPFNKNNATIVTANSTSQSCYKLAAALITTRGVMDDCVTVNALGLGTWCCSTDLCNAAQSTIPMNLKILIFTFLFTIGMMKML